MIDSKGGAFGFDCCLASPKFRVFQQPARADSEEKREPASDIDTAQVNSLKVLDPEWPIREADVFGADSGLIDAIADSYPGAHVLPGAFNTVRAAVALPKGRSAAVLDRLVGIINEAKRTGIVQKAIEQAGLRNGVRVAPD